MRHHTKSKVKGITDTHLAIASVFALAASSFALAAFPLSPPITKSNAASYNCTAEIVTNGKTCKLKNGETGFRNFVYTCPNGKKLKSSNVCRPENTLVSIATQVCTSRRYCVKKPVTPTTSTQRGFGTSNEVKQGPDLSFIGRIEDNVQFYTEDGMYKIKVRYINRGTQKFELADEIAGSSISLVFLDGDQKEVSTVPLSATLSPLAPGQTFEQVFSLPADISASLASAEIKYVKVQINVGTTTPTNTKFDTTAENNFVVVEVPSVTPFPALSSDSN